MGCTNKTSVWTYDVYTPFLPKLLLRKTGGRLLWGWSEFINYLLLVGQTKSKAWTFQRKRLCLFIFHRRENIVFFPPFFGEENQFFWSDLTTFPIFFFLFWGSVFFVFLFFARSTDHICGVWGGSFRYFFKPSEKEETWLPHFFQGRPAKPPPKKIRYTVLH